MADQRPASTGDESGGVPCCRPLAADRAFEDPLMIKGITCVRPTTAWGSDLRRVGVNSKSPHQLPQVRHAR